MGETRIKLTANQLKLFGPTPPTEKEKEDFLKIIESYDIEKYLFGELHEKINRNQYLEKQDFMDICLWKSVRPKKRFEENSQQEIKEITARAFKAKTDTEKLNMLLELKGVGIPTASAILCVYNPKEFGVIDIRAIEVLQSAGLIKSTNVYNTKNWETYNGIVRELAKKYDYSTRAVDKALFTIHKEQLKENLYEVKK